MSCKCPEFGDRRPDNNRDIYLKPVLVTCIKRAAEVSFVLLPV
jgi:hypothetical protein